MAVSKLITALIAVQARMRLTDTELATLLGISEGGLSYITHGQRQPGGKILRGIARELPILHDELIEHLSARKNGDGAEEACGE